jgi:hypothetical protein
MLFWWIDVAYASETEKSVDHLLLHYDVAYALWSALFTRFGLSWVLPMSLTCILVSGRLESRGVPRFGKWCRHAFFGVFGSKEVIGISRIWRSPRRIFYFLFSILCIFGRWLLCPLYSLVLAIFLFIFQFLVKCFLLYTSYVLRGTLCF